MGTYFFYTPCSEFLNIPGRVGVPMILSCNFRTMLQWWKSAHFMTTHILCMLRRASEIPHSGPPADFNRLSRASHFGPLQSWLTSQISHFSLSILCAFCQLWASMPASLCRSMPPAPFSCWVNFYSSSRELSSGWILTRRHASLLVHLYYHWWLIPCLWSVFVTIL